MMTMADDHMTTLILVPRLMMVLIFLMILMLFLMMFDVGLEIPVVARVCCNFVKMFLLSIFTAGKNAKLEGWERRDGGECGKKEQQPNVPRQVSLSDLSPMCVV